MSAKKNDLKIEKGDLITKEGTKTQIKGVILLLLTALIWGSSFVSQSVGMEHVEGFTFNGIRTLMGGIVLLPFVFINDIRKRKGMASEELERSKKVDKRTIKYGMILGVVFCVASNFQQFAFNYSSAGKIAFVTAMYMFFVPLIGIFLKKRIPLLTWICIVIGFVGLYFLCIDPNNIGGINLGDLLAFICAILFAVHILMIERFASDADGLKLSCVQFLVGGILTCIFMFIFETPDIDAILSVTVPLLYSGILSCGVAYTLQIFGQKYTEATVASLLMCMESVFAVIAAAILLHDVMSWREIVGCVIMFGAIILSQFSERFSQKN